MSKIVPPSELSNFEFLKQAQFDQLSMTERFVLFTILFNPSERSSIFKWMMKLGLSKMRKRLEKKDWLRMKGMMTLQGNDECIASHLNRIEDGLIHIWEWWNADN